MLGVIDPRYRSLRRVVTKSGNMGSDLKKHHVLNIFPRGGNLSAVHRVGITPKESSNQQLSRTRGRELRKLTLALAFECASQNSSAYRVEFRTLFSKCNILSEIYMRDRHATLKEISGVGTNASVGTVSVSRLSRCQATRNGIPTVLAHAPLALP